MFLKSDSTKWLNVQASLEEEQPFSHICAACAQVLPRIKKQIQEEIVFNEGFKIYKLLESITQFKFHKHGPHFICLCCLRSIEAVYKFQKKCNEAQIHIREHVQKFVISRNCIRPSTIVSEENIEKQDMRLPNSTMQPLQQFVSINKMENRIPDVIDTPPQDFTAESQKQNTQITNIGNQLETVHNITSIQNMISNIKIPETLNMLDTADEVHEDKQFVFLPTSVKSEPQEVNSCDESYESNKILESTIIKSELNFEATEIKSEVDIEETVIITPVISEESSVSPNKKRKMSSTTVGKSHPRDLKLIECSVCHEHVQSSIMAEHMMNHPKMFRCHYPNCNESFWQDISLKLHIDRHEKENGTSKPQDKPSPTYTLLCKFCQVWFSNRQSLDKHVMQHTAGKPHVCTVCYKNYKYPSDLRKHICPGVAPNM